MTALRGAVERGLNAIWYGNSVLSWCLLPLSLLVRFEVKRRRDQAPLKGATPDGVMVIVIGGLTVGGTGKTPVLIALGRWLHTAVIEWASSVEGIVVKRLMRPARWPRMTTLHPWVTSRC